MLNDKRLLFFQEIPYFTSITQYPSLMLTIRPLLLVAFLLPMLCSHAQTTELDNKNGFLEFKFGSAPTDYAGKIKKADIKEIVNGSQTYLVTAPAYKHVLGYDVSSITLHFANNKLWSITIDFTHEDEDLVYSFLDYKLKTIFGEPSGGINPDETRYFYYLTGDKWLGARTSLDLMKIKERHTGKYFVSMYYKNKELEKQAMAREF
jgi:hypothetical protein